MNQEWGRRVHVVSPICPFQEGILGGDRGSISPLITLIYSQKLALMK